MAFKIRALMQSLIGAGKTGGLTGATVTPCAQTHYPPQPGCFGAVSFPGCGITNTPWACTPTHGTTTWTPVWCTPTHATTTTYFLPGGALQDTASLEALTTLRSQLEQQLDAVKAAEKTVSETLLPTTVEECETLVRQLQDALEEVQAHCKGLSTTDKPSDPK